MAKTNRRVEKYRRGGCKKSRSHKTKKRLEAKKAMLEAKKKKKKK